MILTRLGNKRRIAKKIIPLFPIHDVYMEPFFGAGGMFFSKPKAKYNIVNDNDSDVYNLYMVLRDRKDELVQAYMNMPEHLDLWECWKKNQEADPVMKAVRFIFLSNYGYLGKPHTMSVDANNTKELFMSRIDKTQDMLKGVMFSNKDFRDFMSGVASRTISRAFVYCDPPYLDTLDNYEAGGFSDSDTHDLFKLMMDYGGKFMISEFDRPKVLMWAMDYDLEVIEIGERKNLGNTRVEIIVTNCPPCTRDISGCR